MFSLSSLSIESFEQFLREQNLHPSAAVRLLPSFWRTDGQVDPASLDIALTTQAFLREHCVPVTAATLHEHRSADSTRKLLVGFPAGGSTECVLMPSHREDRAAVCLSSQIGCAMGCDFCASTSNGLERNLSTGEIVEQFLLLRRIARTENRRITSIVFMGMGEPMHNLDAVMQAIRLLTAPRLGQMASRAIAVSTVGIVPGINRLAESDLGCALALSLHAPDDETRAKLVPMNRRYPVAEIMAAAKRYQAKNKRPCNIEYCMLADVNDSDEHAHRLADLMTDFRSHVNLIPYNAIGAGVSGTIYRKPSVERITSFLDILRNRKVVAHVRRTRGDDVAAACGQLRVTQLTVKA